MENETTSKTKSKGATDISVSLIAKRNVNTKELSADKIAGSVLALSHVRLDRENIKNIDNLDCLGPVTNLYLQNNEITKIENLDPLPKLRFLTLANNNIKKIQNLVEHLQFLMFLDLSDNQIQDFNPEELPKSLIILNLSGNPCVMHSDYRSKTLQSLHKLEQLDGSSITKAVRQQAGCSGNESESDDEGEDDEQGEEIITENQDITETGTLDQYCNDILVRAKIRTMREDANHEKRLEELESLRTDVINTARREREREAEEKARMLKSSGRLSGSVTPT